jgi:hypothetical protein
MTTVGRVAGRQLPTLSIRFPVRYQRKLRYQANTVNSSRAQKQAGRQLVKMVVTTSMWRTPAATLSR